MTTTVFTDYVTPVPADWLNDVNTATYTTLATKGNLASPLSQFAATTSAQLASVLSDETGTGVAVFNTSPTLVTPLLGTPTSGVMTNVTGTAAGLTAGGNALLAGSAPQIFSAAAAAAAANVVRADQNVNDLTSVSATIATGFLTVGLQPGIFRFRNSALSNGATSTKFVAAALSLATDNIGASFGLTTAVQGRLYKLLIDDGTATPRLGIINSSGGTPLDETGVLTSTTAIAGAVVSPTTVYTAAALAAGLYPYKVVGAVDIVWTSGSGYVTTPALVTGAGVFIAPSLLTSIGFAKRYNSGNQTITSAGLLTLAHGLGREPILINTWLKCLTAEHGYSIGDKLLVPGSISNSVADNLGYSLVSDSTNLNIRYGASATVFGILTKSTGVGVNPTNANWAFVVEAFA